MRNLNIILSLELKKDISYEFKKENECEKYNTYTDNPLLKGINKNAIIFENESAIYLICIECN